MSKLKIDKGASRIRRVPLKTTIDGTVWDDVELMCQWSENDTSYVVNQLLRFALSQSEEFQEHKRSAGTSASPASTVVETGRTAAIPGAIRAPEAGR
jgi:hypothetical protein